MPTWVSRVAGSLFHGGDAQRVSDVPADALARVEGAGRVLEDRRQLAPAEFLEGGIRQRGQVGAVEVQAGGGDAGVAGQ